MSLNRKSTYRDMEKYRRTRNACKRRYYGKTQKGGARRRWTKEEDAIVLEHAFTDTEISGMIGRSVCSIQVRRSRLVNGA